LLALSAQPSEDLSIPSNSIPPQTTSSTSPHQTLPTSTAPSLPTRRSTRSHKPPSYFQDYVCSNTQTTWCNLVILPPEHMICLSTIEEFQEPSSYEYAAKHPGWVEAMEKEISALQTNNTWEEVDLPPNKKAISCKWVYKTKLKAYGSLERLKARLVIQGFTQQYGVDYQEVFFPCG